MRVSAQYLEGVSCHNDVTRVFTKFLARLTTGLVDGLSAKRSVGDVKKNRFDEYKESRIKT